MITPATLASHHMALTTAIRCLRNAGPKHCRLNSKDALDLLEDQLMKVGAELDKYAAEQESAEYGRNVLR